MYSASRGGPQEPRKAYDLWVASAAQGNKQAQKYLDEVPWWWKARFAVEDWLRAAPQGPAQRSDRDNSAALYTGGDGSTCEKAVVVNASDWRKGVAAEYQYLRQNFPGGVLMKQGLVGGADGRRLDRIEWIKADGSAVSVCFDINEFFGKR